MRSGGLHIGVDLALEVTHLFPGADEAEADRAGDVELLLAAYEVAHDDRALLSAAQVAAVDLAPLVVVPHVDVLTLALLLEPDLGYPVYARDMRPLVVVVNLFEHAFHFGTKATVDCFRQDLVFSRILAAHAHPLVLRNTFSD